MSAMPLVHEEVQERTRQEDEERQHAQGVRPMLGNEEKCGDQEEKDRYEAGLRPPEAGLLRAAVTMRVTLVRVRGGRHVIGVLFH
jgi:hypothetical protein